MPQYIRKIDGGRTWFFTVNLQNRKSQTLTKHIDILRASVKKVRTRYPFEINAWVVLPDHMHAVWTLAEEDSDFSLRWRLIKTYFVKSLSDSERVPLRNEKRGEAGLWQRRFWEHQIRDAEDYKNHIEYCYINPVRHGYVQRVRDWPYSSFHRDVQGGEFPTSWGGPTNITPLPME
ncbi:transposase [gamma proteobacterium HTCC5015]|nr:transposase [gamma proteobacterium HTCC5015]